MAAPKILLIDDEGIVRGALTAVLSQRGYDVVSAVDGRRGLLLLEESSPDLVILDRDMPVMSGSKTLVEIRKRKPDLPVIVLTGWADEEGAEKYRRLGADLFLSKDIEMEALLGAVASHLPAPAVSPPAPSASDRILVVDDDKTIRRLLQRFLEGKGYRVHAVGDGRKALDAVGEFAPKLLLLDLDMPGMNGLEVLRRVRALPEPPGVLMITGTGDLETARECVAAGAEGFISKPFSLDYLDTTVWTKIRTMSP